jgi:predicted DNA-binding transcriptional regulator AlpA
MPEAILQPAPLLVPAETAAAMLGLSRAMFYAMHADGRLGPMAVSFGRRKLWRVSELRAWTENDPPCPPREVWLKVNRA